MYKHYETKNHSLKLNLFYWCLFVLVCSVGWLIKCKHRFISTQVDGSLHLLSDTLHVFCFKEAEKGLVSTQVQSINQAISLVLFNCLIFWFL
jgi:hypothetical protein